MPDIRFDAELRVDTRLVAPCVEPDPPSLIAEPNGVERVKVRPDAAGELSEGERRCNAAGPQHGGQQVSISRSRCVAMTQHVRRRDAHCRSVDVHGVRVAIAHGLVGDAHRIDVAQAPDRAGQAPDRGMVAVDGRRAARNGANRASDARGSASGRWGCTIVRSPDKQKPRSRRGGAGIGSCSVAFSARAILLVLPKGAASLEGIARSVHDADISRDDHSQSTCGGHDQRPDRRLK